MEWVFYFTNGVAKKGHIKVEQFMQGQIASWQQSGKWTLLVCMQFVIAGNNMEKEVLNRCEAGA